MNPIWILLVALFVTGHCQDDDTDPSCPRVKVDTYMKRVIEKVREEMPDPIRLPPQVSFVDLTEGLAWGLSELDILEPPTYTCDDGKTYTIELKLTTEQLKGRYTWKREHKKIMNDRQGFVTFISNDFEAEATIVVVRHSDQENHPQLKRFVINKFKDAKIEITGMGFLSWAIGEMTTLMSGIFQRSIAASIQGPIKEALERQMREISIENF